MWNFNKVGNTIEVVHENGVKVGDILMKEDGYYDFWPELRGGCWPSYMMLAIGKKLEELNEPYEKEINEFFENEEGRRETT